MTKIKKKEEKYVKNEIIANILQHLINEYLIILSLKFIKL